MAQRPVLPADHPMKGYAEYTIERMDGADSMINALVVLTSVLIAFTIVGIVAFSFFGYQKLMERKNLQEWRDEVRNLLAVIKGWTVINKSTSERAVVEVKEELKTVPDATATKVVEAIQTRGSGVIKSTDPNTSRPEAGPQ